MVASEHQGHCTRQSNRSNITGTGSAFTLENKNSAISDLQNHPFIRCFNFNFHMKVKLSICSSIDSTFVNHHHDHCVDADDRDIIHGHQK